MMNNIKLFFVNLCLSYTLFLSEICVDFWIYTFTFSAVFLQISENEMTKQDI